MRSSMFHHLFRSRQSSGSRSMFVSALRETSLPVLLAFGLMLSPATAFAQDADPADDGPNVGEPGTPGEARTAPTAPPAGRGTDQQPPSISGAGKININYVDADLKGLVEYFAYVTGRNFILGETKELESKKVTIISNKPVSPAEAYEAFLSALEIHDLTTVQVGKVTKIIKATDAQQSPGAINEGGAIRSTDNFVTQIFPLTNVSASDVREIIDNLVSPNAKVLAYAPTNTLILTDSGNNLRRIYKLISELDIAAPKSTLEIIPIVYATAEDLKTVIEELYGTEETDTSSSSKSSSRRSSRSSRSSRKEPAKPEGVTAGKAAKYIQKVLADERSNSLIVMADAQGHTAVRDLVGKLDIDVDPTSRSQIYTYRLEHAKAEDVASVLNDLSQGGSGSNRNNQNSAAGKANAARKATREGNDSAAKTNNEPSGAIAAFDSGMRITHDENTNSLVIIASRDDYEVVESVIKSLDVRRKQVFVDCVIVELSSTDGFDFSLAYHAPFSAGGESQGVAAGQFGTNSLGFDLTSALAGLVGGVYGKNVSVPVAGLDGTVTDVSIPAFGIALQALSTNQLVDIISNPSLMAVDNEEAKIVVGRKIPFPQSNGLSSFGQPLVTYQREDVAITLEMTPRINSEDFVTLEMRVEVQEIEESDAIDVNQAGFITSNREIETVVVVGDNQTVVLGGLVGSTDTRVESKVPVLGDLPLIGALFRNRSTTQRRTNLMVFLTPHIVDDEEDTAELMRVKEAQRREFLRRFYGKSQDAQFREIEQLLQYSMNIVDQPSVFRGPSKVSSTATLNGYPISDEARSDVVEIAAESEGLAPGESAGELPEADVDIALPESMEEQTAADTEEGASETEPTIPDVDDVLESEGAE